MRLAPLVLVLTSLPPSVWTQPMPTLVSDPTRVVRDTRGGGAQGFHIESAILGERRRISIVLPPSFTVSAPTRRYPVTVVLDGEVSVPTHAVVSDELTRNGLIPESVIVAIENTNRLRDLTPPGVSVSGSSLREGGDQFLDFIEKELLPAVDRQFRGGAPRTIVGHSSGGLLATYAAATRVTYRNVVAIDAPIEVGQSWVAQHMMTRAATPAGAAIRYASIEARYGWPDASWAQLVAAAPSTWILHRERFSSRETHESIPLVGMYLGLREVWRDYSVTAAPTVPTSAVLPYYASLGAGVAPPQRLLEQVVEDLIDEGRGKAARVAFNLLIEHYGRPLDEADLSARLADAERRPEPTETVEGLIATPFPTPDQVAPYVGDWVGDIWMNPGQPRTGSVTLRIRITDGRVTGETVRANAPPGQAVQRWEYLRITPEGLTFGFMNGMRPRGAVLFEGTLRGDVLSGTNRFGGISPRGPDGNPPPPLYFEFKRVR